MTVAATALAFRTAVESNRMDDAVALLAPDCVFRSPAVHKPYQGREVVGHLLRTVATVFEDFRYDAAFDSPDGHVLLFSARVGDRQLQGVDILRIADEQIAEFTVMVRPLSALTALAGRMAEQLAG